ncbi:MAG TPA: asparaginase [Candidatus Limnocylindria bacterium]
MPRIAVIFTGGTIAMRRDPDAGGNLPTLRGGDLLAAVPGLDAIAEIEPIDWGLVPASHLLFDQVLEVGRLLERALRRPEIDGAVVVQGTDVIEETSFAWDLLPLPAKPIVVVGAMRSASDEGSDGPDNLLDAVTAAASVALADQGAVVAMAGELHAADDVRKTHTHALDTFQSPNAGRIGTIAGGRLTLERTRNPTTRLPVVPGHATSPVPLVTVVLDDAGAVESAIGRDPAGLVVAATGGGNTPPSVLAGARGLIERGIPVMLTTRCPSGQPRPGYAFHGGSSEWWEAGAIFSGTLGGPKSRVLVSLGLGAGLGTAELAATCEAWGGGYRGD